MARLVSPTPEIILLMTSEQFAIPNKTQKGEQSLCLKSASVIKKAVTSHILESISCYKINCFKKRSFFFETQITTALDKGLL